MSECKLKKSIFTWRANSSQPNGPTFTDQLAHAEVITKYGKYQEPQASLSRQEPLVIGGLDHASELQTHSKKTNTKHPLHCITSLTSHANLDHHLTNNHQPLQQLPANTLTANTNRNTPPRQQQTTSQSDQHRKHVSLHE